MFPKVMILGQRLVKMRGCSRDGRVVREDVELLGVVAHTFNSRTGEVEAGGSQ